MKTTTCRLLTLAAALLALPALTLAQTTAVPDQISYQGVVTDAGGTPVGNSAPENRTVVFRVWDHATNSAVGNLIYSEQQVVTISKGEFSVLVGDGTVVTGTPLGFSETAKGKPTVTIPTAFGGTTRFLGVSVYDSGGAVAPEISPRQRVVSSAFAYRAKFAESVGSNGTTALTTLNGGQVGIGNANPPALFTVSGANNSTSTNTPQMIITDAGDTNERLLFGVDSTGNSTGFIQATKVGTGAQNLLLNPNGGNVGINLTNPQNTLHVNGIISSRPSNTAHGYVALQPGDAGNDGYIEWLKPGGGRSAYLGYSGASNLQLTLSGSNHFLVSGNGNVGIGTSPTPTARLEVGGGIASTAGSTSHAQGAHLEWNKTGEGALWLLNQRGLGGGGIIFGDVTTGNVVTEHMRIDGSGNVGIGTTSPGGNLHVKGGLDAIVIQPNASNGTFGLALRDFGGTERGYIGNAGVSAAIMYNTNPGDLVVRASTGRLFLSTSAASSSSNFGIVVHNNSVGIGTTTPAQKLTVQTSSNSYGITHTDGTSTLSTYINGTGGWLGTTSNHQLCFFTNGSGSQMTLATGGNVGIGTLTPNSAKLVVLGGPSQSGLNGPYLSTTGYGGAVTHGAHTMSIYADGGIWTGDFFLASSDERIKTIQGISDSVADLRAVMGIQVTDYVYKDIIGKGTQPQKKVIAQQVEKFFPQAVSKQTEVIPDIYQKATLKDGWVALKTDLKEGERVRIISGKESSQIYEVLEVKKDAFRVDFKPESGKLGSKIEGDQIFVFGREVKDFRTVDYEAISMLNVSATQQIKKEKDAEVKALKDENEMLKATLAAQARQLAELEAKAKAQEETDKLIVTKLAALEKLVRDSSKAQVETVSLKKTAGGAE